jgi:uncharacterized protein (DUF488 family)
MTVGTIGHSTRPIEEFLEILSAHGIEQLVDIRTIPRSRYNPQYNGDALGAALAVRNIRYLHLPELGGLRRARPDSPNTGWRNASFRGYADYMQTPEFERGLEALIQLAEQAPAAMMCAEAVQWRCHRSLVADALLVRGITVQHIKNTGDAAAHKLTPFALVEGTVIVYPRAGKLDAPTLF